MARQINNLQHLINAPAGSGKTTRIKAMINKFLLENPKDNILCITYTNRAADELSKDIMSSNIFVGTIHSFLHNFMKCYFAHQDILRLYFEVYGEKIKNRINNYDEKENIDESNKKYEDKYGELNFETIKKNIKTISYNESAFNSLYYGGLSHDDLISFSKCILEKYPKIQKRIAFKYQFVFIDEYQDTMVDVLKIFHASILNSNSHLYFLGDRMQQIYKNYDGSFEKQYEDFDTTEALKFNHRSVKVIVDLLNNIYNSDNIKQDYSPKMENETPNFPPQVILCDNIDETLSEIIDSNPDTLVLYLLNRERFSAIGAPNLYEVYSKMDKYKHGKNYSVVDVLTTDFNDNPDPLMKLLYCINRNVY